MISQKTEVYLETVLKKNGKLTPPWPFWKVYFFQCPTKHWLIQMPIDWSECPKSLGGNTWFSGHAEVLYHGALIFPCSKGAATLYFSLGYESQGNHPAMRPFCLCHIAWPSLSVHVFFLWTCLEHCLFAQNNEVVHILRGYPPPTTSEIIICSFVWRAPEKNPSQNSTVSGPGPQHILQNDMFWLLQVVFLWTY